MEHAIVDRIPEGTKRKIVKSLTDFARELEISTITTERSMNIMKPSEKDLEAYGDGRLMKMSDNYASLVNQVGYKQFDLPYFHTYTIQYRMYRRTLNVYLGFDYDRGLQVVQDIHEDEITFFKALPMKRISIIKTIKDGELFASEIAERWDYLILLSTIWIFCTNRDWWKEDRQALLLQDPTGFNQYCLKTTEKDYTLIIDRRIEQ